MKRKFHVLLPIYNNYRELINFIRNYCINKNTYDYFFYIFDCSENNNDFLSNQILSITDYFKIYKLSPKSYWGNCLNYISKKLPTITNIDKNDVIYIANVDTLILKNTLTNVSKLIDKLLLISASYLYLDYEMSESLSEKNLNIDLENQIFKSNKIKSLPILKKFSIKETKYFNPCSKIAPTCGLFVLGSTFLSQCKIMKNVYGFIPHYYSDYYFTYILSNKSFNIHCLKSIMIIRFKNKKEFNHNPFSIFSPSYLPANFLFYNAIVPYYLIPISNLIVLFRFFKDLLYYLLFEFFQVKK